MNINNPTTFGTPNLTLATSNSSGTGGALRADDTILVFDTTLPAAIGTSATGSAVVTTRRDHVHAGPTQATQAALEDETNQDTYAPPDLLKYSPGVAKVWCQVAGNNTLRSPNYNVASVTNTATGNRTIVYTVDFSTSVYSVVGAMNETGDYGDQIEFDTFAVGSVRNLVRAASALVAQETGMAAFGDQ